MIRKFSSSPIIIGLFCFLVTFIIYINNLPVTALSGDGGDFLTAITTRGLAHPSGYPTYVLLGIIFTYLPLPVTIAFKVGILTSLLASLSVFFMFLFLFKLTKSLVISTISVFTLAFVYAFWLYAESVEIFSLHYLFVIVLLCVSYLYYLSKNKHLLLLLAFLLGLSLTNNFTIIFVFPSVFLLVLSKKTFRYLTPKFLLLLAVLFLVGLLPYLYLLYGSYFGPTISWKRIENLSGFWSYVSRKDYGWGTNLQTGITLENRVLALQSFATYWLTNIPGVYFIFCILGMFFTVKKNKIIFLSLLSGICFSGGFFLLYTGNRIGDPFVLGTLEKFYVMPLLFTLPFFAYGIVYFRELIMHRLRSVMSSSSSRKLLEVSLVLVFAVFPVYLFLLNSHRTNFKELTIGDDHVKALLSTLPPDSILFLKSDTLHFNASYVQHAYNHRKDILLATTPSLKVFIASDKRYRDMMNKIILSKKYKEENDVLLATAIALKDDRPVFSEKLIGIGIIDPRKEMIPYGLIYRLRNDGEKMSQEEFVQQQKRLLSMMHVGVVKKIANAENLPLLMMIIPYQYTQVFLDTGEYVIDNYNDLSDAKFFFRQAHEISRFTSEPLSSLIRAHMLLGECVVASRYIEQLEDIDQDQALIYRKLIKSKKYCSKQVIQ